MNFKSIYACCRSFIYIAYCWLKLLPHLYTHITVFNEFTLFLEVLSIWLFGRSCNLASNN